LISKDEKTIGGTNQDVLTSRVEPEGREATPDEAPRGDVEEEAAVDAILGLLLVEHHPLTWAKTAVFTCPQWSWLGDGDAPVAADSPHVNVAVDIVSCQQQVSDHVNDILWKIRPVRHGSLRSI
jgi:hypothetical protein